MGLLSSLVHAAGINDYGLARTFTLPTPTIAFSNVLFDALPDGRLLALNGTTVLRETAVKSGTFTALGTVGNFSTSFGATFLTVSPDGTRAAVGSNGGGSVVVFNTATPSAGTAYAADDNDAAWIDNNRLAISNTSGVQVLNTATGTLKTAITGIGGAPAGIAFDTAGNLYTGNGFGNSAGSQTGYVKAFSKTAWEAAAATGGTAINFASSGTAIADLLSASSLGFDASGNFYVGGGDFFGGSGDYGYAALVNAASIQAALAAGASTPSINTLSSATVLRKFVSPPATVTAQQPPVWAYNDVTGELYLRYAFGNGVVSAYAVPEPSAMCGLLLAGAAVLRRRRRAIAGAAAVTAVGVGANHATATVYDPMSFATQVVASTNLPADGLYDDPAAVLGAPTLKFNNGSVASPDLHRAKLIEGTFNTGPANEKLITTFKPGQSLTVKMGRPVTDDPSHPFGIDFNVFGNAFFLPSNTGGFTGDDTNLNTATVGSVFAEDVRVSVSPDNINWYSYTQQTGDGYFPTNAYRWDRAAAMWSDDTLDPTKAVDPAIAATLSGKTAADVLDLYKGAAGGTGFDLALSGFTSIQYVRFDGLADYSGGEIDAVAGVPEPAVLGLVGLMAATVLGRNRA